MTVMELIKKLKVMPKDADVNVEIRINGIEFDAEIEEVYKSGNIYLFGKGDYNVKIINDMKNRG